MEQMIHITTVDQITKSLINSSPDHPLISIIDFSKVDICGTEKVVFTSDLYMILLKDNCNGDIRYGRQNYDFNDGVLSFFAPNQVITIEPIRSENESNTGWGLFFNPDFLAKTSLAKNMKNYSFFEYSISEALHSSDTEKATLIQCIENIKNELTNNLDTHSEEIAKSNLELFLNYCTRFFERQFLTRKKFENHILEQFEEELNSYFSEQNVELNGLPSVKYFAEKLSLTPNYLSDYLKKISGFSTQEFIQRTVISEAKIRLLNNKGKSINQIAYELGFDNPSYFTRLFKKRVGKTPSEYISLN